MNNFCSAQDRERHEVQAAARFDDWADKYGEDRISSWFQNNQKLALSRLNISNDGNFLDVGCGTGSAVRMAAPLVENYNACGVDISPKMVDKATGLAKTKSNIKISRGSAEQIPYPANYFKYIICTCSFHHYQNPEKALVEIKRVMASDGKLILIDSGRDVFFPIWLQDRFRRYFEKSHVRYYTVTEITRFISRANLTVTGEVQTIKQTMLHKKVFTGLMVFEIVQQDE